MENYLGKRSRLIKLLVLETDKLESQGNYNIKTYADAYSDIIKEIFNVSSLSELLLDWDIFDYMFDTDSTPQETIIEIINQLDKNIGEL